MKKIYTIGYEKASLDEFVATLRNVGIECVLDVRAKPISRKRGFSKKILSEVLSDSGLVYVHLAALGNTLQGRDAAKVGHMTEFRRLYRSHLDTKLAQDAMLDAVSYATNSSSCLVCFEREPEQCHRNLLAIEISKLYGFSVNHLYVAASAPLGATHAARRKSSGIGQGGAAAQQATW